MQNVGRHNAQHNTAQHNTAQHNRTQQNSTAQHRTQRNSTDHEPLLSPNMLAAGPKFVESLKLATTNCCTIVVGTMPALLAMVCVASNKKAASSPTPTSLTFPLPVALADGNVRVLSQKLGCSWTLENLLVRGFGLPIPRHETEVRQ